MAALLKLKPGGNTDRVFCLWLLTKIDPLTMRLNLGDGRFREINAREVRRILGLAGGSGRTRVLRRMCLRNRLEVLERVHDLLGNEYAKCASISILRLKTILQNARREELTPAVRRKIKVDRIYHASLLYFPSASRSVCKGSRRDIVHGAVSR